MAKRKLKEAEEIMDGEDYVLTAAPAEKQKKEPYVKLKLDIKLQNKIVKTIMDEVDSVEDNEDRKAFLEHCRYARKRYLMEDYVTDDPWEGCSKRRTGGSTIAMDRLIPREKKAIYYSGHIIDVSPGKENTDSNAEMQEVWIDSTLRYELKDEEKCENLLYDANFLNFGCEKNHWVDETEVKETVAEYESAQELLRNYPDALDKYPQYVLALTGYADLETLVKDYPLVLEGEYDDLPAPRKDKPIRLLEKYRDGYIGHKAEWIDPEYVIFPKGTTDYKTAWMCGHHQKMRKDELLRKSKKKFFENVDKMFKDKDDKTTNESLSKEYDVYEVILRYDIDKDGLEEKCVFWVGRSDAETDVYLRGIRFPFDHGNNNIIVYRTDSTRYGFYTGGLAAKLKSTNESEDKRVNQIANAWDQAICKSWHRIITPGSPYDPLKHKRYPGAEIPVANAEELTEAGMSDIPASSITLLEDNRREGELLLGFSLSATSGQVMPQDPGGPAKKHEIEITEGEVSIEDRLRKYIIGYKEKVSQMQSNYYQFSNTTEINFRSDNGFEDITKQQIRAKAMFTMQSAVESIDAQSKAKADLALLQVSQQDPLMANNLQFRMYLWENIVQNWSEQHARNKDLIMSDEVKGLIIEQLTEARQKAEMEALEEQFIKKLEKNKKKMSLSGVPPEKIDRIIAEEMAAWEEQSQGA